VVRTAFINANVYTPTRIINDGVVVIGGRKVEKVGKRGQFNLKGMKSVDVKGHYLVPGFVDLHVHGGGGGDFVDGALSAVKAAARYHCGCGTTTMFASTSTHKFDKILKALKVLRKAVRKDIKGMAWIPGVHVEGPFLTKREPGCHNIELLLDPVPRNTGRVMKYADIISRVTLAPEEKGAMRFIRELSRKGIVVSVGHSAATYEEVARAAQAGATHVTHLWSSMSTVTRKDAKRFSGVLEAALERDDLTAEIIADGKHLPTSLMRLAYKCKGPEKLAIVTDSMRALGLPEGRMYEVCGQMALYEDGVGYTPDRKAFASSVISLDMAVRHMVQTVGVSLMDALRMATLTPAEIMRIDDTKGSIAPGREADLVVLHKTSLKPVCVVARGKKVQDKGKLLG